MLFGKSPVITTKESIAAVGFNEAHVLQQIYYWVEGNREAGRNYHDGHYWTYNTYEEWHKHFFWWSESTIRRLIANLEKIGVVKSANYNKEKFDHTKWYTVDEDVLARLEIEGKRKLKALAQNEQIGALKKNSAIPKNNNIQRITEKELSVSDADLRETRAREERKEAFKVLGEKAREAFADPKNKWAIDLVNKYINEWYEQETGRKHKQMGKALRMIYAYKLIECQQITENDRCAEIEPTDFENALKLAIQCHDCKDPTIMWATSDKVLGYWLVESGGCFYQDIMSTKYGFSDDAEKAFESWSDH